VTRMETNCGLGKPLTRKADSAFNIGLRVVVRPQPDNANAGYHITATCTDRLMEAYR
jgi:hypothetical protein